MSNRQTKPIWGFMAIVSSVGLVFALFSLLLFPKPVSANPAIVINEIMYNPVSDDSDDEFIELHNTSGSNVDIGSWCFSDGVSLCFDSGTEITAGGYIIVSPNAAKTLSTYSVTTTTTYTGKLSNGGEKLELSDESGSVVDTVDYLDEAPWPNSTDGTGPSLELTDPTLDNNLSTSWSASFVSGGTPNADNTMLGLNLPSASNASTNTIVDSGSTVTVTATVSNATTVNLVYKVMFGSEVTLTMNDDGASGDGASGDGVYGATIPAQADGSLVRYRIDAVNGDGTTSLPGVNDSTNYYPYIVDDGQTSDLPIVRWYMDPADFTDMTTNHLTDDTLFPAVVGVGEQIFDNAEVRVKGQGSVYFPKRKYKFELPKGYTLGSPIFTHPVDEVAIQASFLSLSDMQEGLGWRAFSEFGFEELQNRYVRVHKNDDSNTSDFHGHYLLIENYDGLWRERNGYDTGAMYKQALDKKTRLDEDNTDIQNLENSLTTLEDEELKQYLLDNLNIPVIVNYNAISSATFHNDWNFNKNIYEYRDTEGNGRWEYLPWDLDNQFLPLPYNEVDLAEYFKEPIISLAAPAEFTGNYYDLQIIERALYQFPEFKNMFLRRVMSLYDQIWANDKYLEWHDGYYQISNPTMEDDYTKWNPFRQATLEAAFPDGFPFTFPPDMPVEIDEDDIFGSAALQSPESMRSVFEYSANRLKSKITAARSNSELLQPQSTAQEQAIKINEIHYNPTSSQDHEYIEFYNNSDTPIDMSTWSLEGVGFTFPHGSVLPAKSYGVIAKKDTSFRGQYNSAVVFGEYTNNLSNSGQQLTLKNSSGTTISNVNFGVSESWPTSPNGQGYSLSLISPDADESKASCWAPSQTTGGSPYAVNIVNASWDTSDCFPVTQANVSSNAGTNYAGNQAEEEDLIGGLVSGSLNQPTATTSLSNLQNNNLVLFIAGLGISLILGFVGSKAYANMKARKIDDNTDIQS